MPHDTTPDDAATVVLTDEQRMRLMQVVAEAFPPYCIWWSDGVYYATGPCPEISGGSETLHNTNLGLLAEQLTDIIRQRAEAAA